MANLLDRGVASRVILQPAPALNSMSRAAFSFSSLNALGSDEGIVPLGRDEGIVLEGLEDSEEMDAPLTHCNTTGHDPGKACHAAKRDSALQLHPMMPKSSSAGKLNSDLNESVHSLSLITFDKSLGTFSLRAGDGQYIFCIDRKGTLEHLHFGTWLGTGHDLTYLSETDPNLIFEPAPAGTQYSTTELLRLVCENSVDHRQLWFIATQMKNERRGDRHMARVENITWRLMHFRTKRDKLEGKMALDDAEAILKLLDSSNIGTSRPVSEVTRMSSKTAPETHPEEPKGRQGEQFSKLTEISESGTGDFRTPSLELCFRSDGSHLLPLVYRGHKIVNGVVPSKTGMPVLGAHNPRGAQTLIVDMVDPYTELKIQLLYTVFPGLRAVSRRTLVHNTGRVVMGRVELQKCMSGTFDFPTDDWHLVSLHGGWAHEQQITIRALQQGTIALGSKRGVSSHQVTPFCVLTSGSPQEEHGRCWGFSLLYSGNWLMEIELSQTGCVRVNAGINPSQFSWDLRPQDTFESPEVVCVYSGNGLSDITRTFHELFAERLIAPRWRDLVCPVLINTWEAFYFAVNHERVMELARAAKEIGVEMVVLDDGWFGNRNDDTSSLGDWNHDPKKFPEGLAGVVRDVNSLGMKFGIWMEPEMVNFKSELFTAHPDWVLHHPSRLRSEGRNQLVLDLSRLEVQNYIIDSVTNVLSGANIEYVKWDMNRALTDAFSMKLPASQQGEVYHRYIMGLYRIFEIVTGRFPHVIFESCASGGGRNDPGLLAWCPQVWTSDNTDAFSRTRIQMGASLWQPTRCQGSHISACPNHQTHRTVMMKTRFIVSLCGTFGLELDVTKLSKECMSELRELVELRKELCPVTLHGRFLRLPGFGYPGAAYGNSASIGESNVYSWMFVARDSKRAVVVAIVCHRDTVGKFPSRLKLRGLLPDAFYKLKEHVPTPQEEGVFNGMFQAGGTRFKHNRALCLSGAVLMGVGLPIHFNFDGDSVLLELNA